MSIKFSMLFLLAALLVTGCPAADEEVEGDEAGECSDGADNDQDGAADCADSGCAADLACAGDDDDATGDDDDATPNPLDVDDDGDGVTENNGDCDDSDPANFPGNDEVCDGQDNDCDTTTEATGGEVDGDADEVFSCDDCDDNDPSSTVVADDADCDGVLTADDCNDTNPDSTVMVGLSSFAASSLSGLPVEFYVDGVLQTSGFLSVESAASSAWFGVGFGGGGWALDSVEITDISTGLSLLSEGFATGDGWTVAQGCASCGSATISNESANGSSDWQHFWFSDALISLESPLSVLLSFSTTASTGMWARFNETQPSGCSGCCGLCGIEYQPVRAFSLDSSGSVGASHNYVSDFSATIPPLATGSHTIEIVAGGCP